MNTAQENTTSAPAQTPNILLMEDEVYLGRGLQMVLSGEGYRTHLAMTGLTALDAFGKQSFDLLVADLRLPDIDGMEVIKQVKEKEPEVEVIVITGYPSISSAKRAVEIGAFHYLPKPFTEDEFRAAVEGALQRRQEAAIKDLFQPEKPRLIEKQEVIRALESAAEEESLLLALIERGSQALEGYEMSSEAKAAITSGDLNWLREHVGDLTDKQLLWIRGRLEMERW